MKKVLGYIKENTALIVKGAVYLFTLVNTLCVSLGWNLPVTGDEVYQIVSVIVLIAVFAYGVWDNFSVTEEAKAADRLLEALKQGTVQVEEAKVIIDQLSAMAEAEEGEES